MQGRGTFEYFGRNGIRHDVIFCGVVLCGVDFVLWCGGVVMVLCCGGVISLGGVVAVWLSRQEMVNTPLVCM